MAFSMYSLLTHSFRYNLIIFPLSHVTLAEGFLHYPRADSTSIQSQSMVLASPSAVRTALEAVSTSAQLYLVSQPSTSPEVTPTPQPKDQQMNMKFLIPIVVGTFLASAAITIIAIYLYFRRRRQRKLHPSHDQSGMTALPSTPRSPFVQSPGDAYAVSPLSPAYGRPYSKDTQLPFMDIFGNVLVHEVGSGRRTPQEVLGDTTWAKGDLSPEVNRVSRYTAIEGSDRVSRYTVGTRSTNSPRR